MKEVLYISNVEVPYRNEFFNQLAHVLRFIQQDLLKKQSGSLCQNAR